MGLGQSGEKDFTQPLRLLVVDTTADRAAALGDRLRKRVGGHADVLVRDSVPPVNIALREGAVDCIVLHLTAGDDDAPDALDAVLSSAPDVPVVVLADTDEESIALRAIRDGAQDFLIERATDADALDRAIRYAIERKRAAARLAHQALHDPLTGLPNRVLLLDRLNVAVGRARRHPTSLALLFLDLDGFKRVNDGLGHDAGDDVLVEVARRLQRTLRPGDTVVRYGGDEFVVLCEDLRGQREALRVGERARAAIAEPFLVRGQELSIRASVGVARARRGQTYAQDLIREADLAMYRAKQRSSGVELFDSAMSAEAMSELDTEHHLRGAIERGELRLHYQPVVSFHVDQGLVAIEALVRWQQPGQGVLAPAEFLPLVEETGFIAQIDQWALAEACLQLARWRSEGAVGNGVWVSVNISPRSLGSPSLADAVDRALVGARLPPSCLCLEVTETTVDEEPVRAAAVLENLKRLGVRLCLDNFGTGHASIGALSRFPFDVVKFDRAGITPALGDAKARQVLAAVLAVAHAAERDTIAKSIETRPELELARELGFDGGQGFLVAPPAPADALTGWLASRNG
ncbi:MAG TPA: EAL domain-containing protein [Solirubrobacteraceae bacterium]|nr:EAL domain-containing protein [Solirubrobacteraceae bacterium]